MTNQDEREATEAPAAAAAPPASPAAAAPAPSSGAAAAPRRWPWVVSVVASVVAVASTAYFWLNRPEWGYCVDGEDFGFCDQGVFSSNAIVGTILLGVGLVGLLVAVGVARQPRRARIVVIAAFAFAVLLIAAWVLQLVPLEQVQIPNGPPFESD